jgi:hypothetical protein
MGYKVQLVCKAGNLTAICELTIQKMWDPWHLTTPNASSQPVTWLALFLLLNYYYNILNRTNLITESSKYIFFNTKSACVECLKVFNCTACWVQILRAAAMMHTLFWDAVLCGPVVVHWPFKRTVSHLHGQRLSLMQEVSRVCVTYPLTIWTEEVYSLAVSKHSYCTTQHFIYTYIHI